MTLPYLPAGVTSLPANRFVLFADETNLVQRVDESAKLRNGVSFTGWWETGSLNQGALHEMTIILVTFAYSSPVNTTLTAKVSGNGGETWNETKALNIYTTGSDRMARDRLGFRTSGFDIRLRIELDTDEVINLYELHPELVVRGKHVVSR